MNPSSAVNAADFLPYGLALIMLGLGLSLTTEDFRRILRFPRPVAIGLFAQIFLLPALAFVLCGAFELSPAYSVGVMILAASPGGVLANLFSHLAHGDVALNVTLTAVNSVLAAFTLPLIVGFALAHFGDADRSVGLQFGKAVEVFAVVLVPVALGMAIRRRNPRFADRADRPIRVLAVSLLVVLVLGALFQQRETLLASFGRLGAAMLAFNLLSMAVASLVARIARLSREQSTAIVMEVGLHNGTLAMTIGFAVLGRSDYALPAALYCVIMSPTASLVALFLGMTRSVRKTAGI